MQNVSKYVRVIIFIRVKPRCQAIGNTKDQHKWIAVQNYGQNVEAQDQNTHYNNEVADYLYELPPGEQLVLDFFVCSDLLVK